MSFQPLTTTHGFSSVLIAFLIFCIAGTFWEEILYRIQHHAWVKRTGTVIGPFSPIYGYGAVAFSLLLGPFAPSMPWWVVYLISCLIGGAMEFIMSLVAEKVFHEVIWDYHGRFLNIMGRTTVPFMLGWGAGGLILMKVLYPLLLQGLALIPRTIGLPVVILLTIFTAVNLFLTYGSLGRQTARAAGKEPGVIGRFFDKHYPDEWLKNRFPAISFEDNNNPGK